MKVPLPLLFFVVLAAAFGPQLWLALGSREEPPVTPPDTRRLRPVPRGRPAQPTLPALPAESERGYVVRGPPGRPTTGEDWRAITDEHRLDAATELARTYLEMHAAGEGTRDEWQRVANGYLLMRCLNAVFVEPHEFVDAIGVSVASVNCLDQIIAQGNLMVRTPERQR